MQFTSSLRCTMLFVLALIAAAASQAAAATRYVNVALTTGADNGTSWANAYRTSDGVSRAIATAVAGDEIWVARGRYVPSTTGVRTASIALRTGVGIYGGFVGNETTREQRNASVNTTILSGDLGNNDPVVSDNSIHVVSGNSAAATAILDGFVITAGNANAAAGAPGDQDRGGGMIFLSGSNATIRSCIIQNSAATFGGGGTYIRQSSPTFTDCIWQNNNGGFFGGAIDMFNTCSPVFSRCIFRGNTANRAGGVEAFGACNPVLNNCLFVANTAGSAGGGAMFVSDSSTVTLRHCTIVRNASTVAAVGILVNNGTASIVRVRNSIVFGNTTSGGAAATALAGTTIQATYSCIQGGFAGAGNISVNPGFVDAVNNDYRLAANSPCIDATNKAETLATEPLDVGGNQRVVDDPQTADTGLGAAPFADMGAYEFQPAGCDSIDFNQNTLFPEDQDLVDFLSVLAGGACSTASCNDIDFNNDGLFPSDDDLVAFLRVLAGGAC